MTHREALYRAVCSNPHDDTPRLVFADWLDENDERVKCFNCHGLGKVTIERTVMRGGKAKEECSVCEGTGQLNENAEQAQYIRDSIAIQYPPMNKGFAELALWKEKETRCRKTECKYGKKWCNIECRRCDGIGRVLNDEDKVIVCPACSGLLSLSRTSTTYNDVMEISEQIDEEQINMDRYVESNRNVTFKRGFVDRVECRLEELPTIGKDDKLVISSWCIDIVKYAPITQFDIHNRNPSRVGIGKGAKWRWYLEPTVTGFTRPRDTQIPALYFHEMAQDMGIVNGTTISGEYWIEFSDRTKAMKCLGESACNVVRRVVFGESRSEK